MELLAGMNFVCFLEMENSNENLVHFGSDYIQSSENTHNCKAHSSQGYQSLPPQIKAFDFEDILA